MIQQFKAVPAISLTGHTESPTGGRTLMHELSYCLIVVFPLS